MKETEERERFYFLFHRTFIIIADSVYSRSNMELNGNDLRNNVFSLLLMSGANVLRLNLIM